MKAIMKTLILDGGLGTLLESKGISLSSSPLWTSQLLIDNPDILKECHFQFLKSNAVKLDVITTSSYQASQYGFLKQGISEMEANRLLVLSVQLAEDAIRGYCVQENKPLSSKKIAISMGCYGSHLMNGAEYTGQYPYEVTEDIIIKYHLYKLDYIADFTTQCVEIEKIIAFETIPNVLECNAVIKVARSLRRRNDWIGQCRVWISFCCRGDSKLSSGESLAQLCEFLEKENKAEKFANVFAIGINCVNPINAFKLLSIMRQYAPSFRLLFYPNSGNEWDEIRKVYAGNGQSDQEFGRNAIDWTTEFQLIAVGGCCHVSPSHIKSISEHMQAETFIQD